jgi:hypothetical protein
MKKEQLDKLVDTEPSVKTSKYLGKTEYNCYTRSSESDIVHWVGNQKSWEEQLTSRMCVKARIRSAI